MIDDNDPTPWNPTGELEGDADDEARAGWRIRSDREATWALRKMHAAQAEIDRVKAEYDAERERLDAFLAGATAKPSHDLEFFEGALVGYRLELEAENPELPITYKLPGGNLTRRAGSKVIEVDNLGDFTAWAIRSGRLDLLRVEPAKKELAAKFQAVHPKVEGTDHDEPIGSLIDPETGETVQGIQHVLRPPTYDVKLT